MLDELEMCYDKFLSHKKSNDEESEQASEVLVEILLSFASKPSHLFRKMSEQVFGAFADKLTPTGLQSLLAVSGLLYMYFRHELIAIDPRCKGKSSGSTGAI